MHCIVGIDAHRFETDASRAVHRPTCCMDRLARAKREEIWGKRMCEQTSKVVLTHVNGR